MKKETWKRRITEACRAAGTYRDFFLPVIDTLASILERRDDAQEKFKASGGSVLVKHTNKGGATNIEQNPALRLINELNRDALAYWVQLGLTPAGLKKINEDAMKPRKQNTLDAVLREVI